MKTPGIHFAENTQNFISDSWLQQSHNWLTFTLWYLRVVSLYNKFKATLYIKFQSTAKKFVVQHVPPRIVIYIVHLNWPLMLLAHHPPLTTSTGEPVPLAGQLICGVTWITMIQSGRWNKTSCWWDSLKCLMSISFSLLPDPAESEYRRQKL